ncbi:MAG: hypothetical protein U9M98_01805 [Patescibacteria group bacterium]|nr:hypothetical protein [Patescibacteria group bacterium]
MMAPNKFWFCVAATAMAAVLLALSWGHAAPEWLEPGARVICQKSTLAKTYPDPEFSFEPLAPKVKEGATLTVTEGKNWRERVGLISPEYYVLVSNEHGVELGYVREDCLVPTENG